MVRLVFRRLSVVWHIKDEEPPFTLQRHGNGPALVRRHHQANPIRGPLDVLALALGAGAGVSDELFQPALSFPVAAPHDLIPEKECRLGQVAIEATCNLIDVLRHEIVRAEYVGHDLAKRGLPHTLLAPENDCNLVPATGVLGFPGEPVHQVLEAGLMSAAQNLPHHFDQAFTRRRPVRFDAEAGPQV